MSGHEVLQRLLLVLLTGSRSLVHWRLLGLLLLGLLVELFADGRNLLVFLVGGGGYQFHDVRVDGDVRVGTCIHWQTRRQAETNQSLDDLMKAHVRHASES